MDKHTLYSTYTGENEYGHATFDTVRTEIGESLYRLKYKGDWAQLEVLASALRQYALPLFPKIGFIVPMPPSKQRARQPVAELARALGAMTKTAVFENLLVRSGAHAQLKNLVGKEQKLLALKGQFIVNDEITNQGSWNALVVDDLYDTGASLEAATEALKSYKKVSAVYVATLTWK